MATRLGGRRGSLSLLNEWPTGSWNEEEEAKALYAVRGAFKINIPWQVCCLESNYLFGAEARGVLQRLHQAVGLLCISTLDLARHSNSQYF